MQARTSRLKLRRNCETVLLGGGDRRVQEREEAAAGLREEVHEAQNRRAARGTRFRVRVLGDQRCSFSYQQLKPF